MLIHAVAMTGFFLGLHDVPSYVNTLFSFSISLSAVVMNMGSKHSFEINFEWFWINTWSGVGREYITSLFDIFEEPLYSFLITAALSYLLTNSALGVQLLLFPCNTVVVFCYFDGWHPDAGEVIFHCGFDIYISLMICDDEHLFICLLAVCILSLEKCLFNHCFPFQLGYLFCCSFV